MNSVFQIHPELYRVGFYTSERNDGQRRLIKGFLRFALEAGNWKSMPHPFYHLGKGQNTEVWDGDGLLMATCDEELIKWSEELDIPVVNMIWTNSEASKIQHVVTDWHEAARIIFEYYQQKGVAEVGWIAPRIPCAEFTAIEYSLRDKLQEDHASLAVCMMEASTRFNEALETRLNCERWLKHRKFPLGLVVWNHEMAQEVMSVCDRVGFRIPDDVSLLSLEQDPLKSELATYPLSFLVHNADEMGYQAALLLDRMMKGEAGPSEPVRIPPLRIEERYSSQSYHFDDSVINKALQFIRDHATKPIQVQDVEVHVNRTRRVLEHRFAKHLQESPASLIRKKRIKLARQLLCETSLPLKKIANRAGFNHVEVLVRTFRRELGITPGEYRRNAS